MRDALTLCASIMVSCLGNATRHRKVLRIVKMDGKILVMKSPIKVEEILKSFPGSGIGVSEKTSEFLPLNYQLKLGKLYYVLPSNSNKEKAESESGGVKRIKVVITKKQLQQLLEKQLSVQEVLLSTVERRRRSASWEVDSPTSNIWKPKLEAIPFSLLWSLELKCREHHF